MSLVLDGGTLVVIRIESDRQPCRILAVTPASGDLRNERSLKVGRVIFGLGQRIAGKELISIVVSLVHYKSHSAIPGLAERRVLQNGRRRSGDSSYILGPAAWE